MMRINTLNGHERMSTQDLLLRIESAVRQGETDFYILASGQHDIGGPLWNQDGKKLHFRVSNPGQRVGSMCLPDTEIRVDGPAPADVGWLNAGGQISVRGDAGDTAGHCAASGRIYIGGRAGTRSGSLMKHDPLYEPPELWVLQSVGSFSFEFMGGGYAVVCGHDSQTLPSVLGARPCVGMVGGTVYFRGPVAELPPDVRAFELDDADIAWLRAGMPRFLEAIDRHRLERELSIWKHWRKIVPARQEAGMPKSMGIAAFHSSEWFRGGLFGDVRADDMGVAALVEPGPGRLRVPEWRNGLEAAPCQFSCPAHIPSQKRFGLLRQGRTGEALALVLRYSPFPGSVCGSVCPNPCMDACTRKSLDAAIQIGALGLDSAALPAPAPAPASGRSVGVIGGGVAGLSAAWQLALAGHEVCVYEADSHMGGKLYQVIPRARMDLEILEGELARIESIGVSFRTGVKVDAGMFAELRLKHDALVLATGGQIPRVFPWPGHERIMPALDFLKAVNAGKQERVPENVVVIGCGNAGMDAAAGAFAHGARKVVCVDVQKPAAFAHEIRHIESLGGQVRWPVQTREITEAGLITGDGELIPAGLVLIAVGETPDLDYVPDEAPRFRQWLAPAGDMSVMEGVFAAGDIIKPGLLAHAIGSGLRAAAAANAWLGGPPVMPALPPANRIQPASLHTAWFEPTVYLPMAAMDYERCISCGTCRDCGMCAASCPRQAISRAEARTETGFAYMSDPERCIGCGICAGVCPCGVWRMRDNDPLP